MHASDIDGLLQIHCSPLPWAAELDISWLLAFQSPKCEHICEKGPVPRNLEAQVSSLNSLFQFQQRAAFWAKVPFFSPLPLLCFGHDGEGRWVGGKARDQTQIIPWYSARESRQVVIPPQTWLQSKSSSRFTIKSSTAEKSQAVLFL